MALSTKQPLALMAGVLALVMTAAIAYEGYALHKARSFNAALERGDFLQTDQRTARGRFAGAYALQQEGEFEKALTAYGEVNTRDAELAAAVTFNTANLYLRRALLLEGEDARDLAIPLIELAKENYRDLLRSNSQHWDAKYNLERALSLLPEPEEQETEDDIMPERSPRALTAAPARGELP